MRIDEPFTKPLGMPSWVAPDANPNMTYGGPSAINAGRVGPGVNTKPNYGQGVFGDPSAIGAGVMGKNPFAGGVDFSSQAGGQQNVGRQHNPAFNWSGVGPNPNDKPMQQHGYGGGQPSDMMNKLPPQLQQFIDMMKGGGQMPQGFMGFNPVNHNPWGGNVNPWGQGDTQSGMYGGDAGLAYG